MFTSRNFFYSFAGNRVAKLFSLPSFLWARNRRWKEDFPQKLSSETSFRIHGFLCIKGEKQAKFLFSFTAMKCYFEWRREGVAADSQANYFDLSSQFVKMILYWQRSARGWRTEVTRAGSGLHCVEKISLIAERFSIFLLRNNQLI